MQKLFQGLRRTKERLFGSLQGIFSGGALGADALEELEGVLLSADLGPEATERIIERLRAQAGGAAGPGDYRRIMAEELLSIIRETPAPEPPKGRPRVIVVVGVNGVGKTSTIGKLAYLFKNEGHSVVLAACDTFRAAAVEQLELWAERAGVPIVRQRERGGPRRRRIRRGAIREGEERRYRDRRYRGSAPHEGQSHGRAEEDIQCSLDENGGRRPRELARSRRQYGAEQPPAGRGLHRGPPGIGLVLTKLDSTAKGGAIVTIQRNLRVPVIYVGVGEAAGGHRTVRSRAFRLRHARRVAIFVLLTRPAAPIRIGLHCRGPCRGLEPSGRGANPHRR